MKAMIMFKCQFTGKSVIVNPIDCEFILDEQAAVCITKAGNRYQLGAKELGVLLNENGGAGIRVVAVTFEQPAQEQAAAQTAEAPATDLEEPAVE